MKMLAIEPLTKEAFAAFGDVIELEGAKQIPINLGTTIRFHDLAKWTSPTRTAARSSTCFADSHARCRSK